jgi:hypothetical protein
MDTRSVHVAISDDDSNGRDACHENRKNKGCDKYASEAPEREQSFVKVIEVTFYCDKYFFDIFIHSYFSPP